MDIPLIGSHFTWTNRRQGNQLIQVKLDRFLISSNWNILQNVSLTSFPRMGSDHSTRLLEWDDRVIKKPYPFRYEIMWTLHPDFKSLIEECWNLPCDGTPMFRLT